MRRRSRGERTPLYAEINVVSLIDVMMLLLVIFMITAPIMQGGVDVALPKVQAAPLASKQGKDGVYVRADQDVNYGLVVQVLAIIRGAGVTNVGLVAVPEEVVK